MISEELRDKTITDAMLHSREVGFCRAISAAYELVVKHGHTDLCAPMISLLDSSFELANMTIDERRGRQNGAGSNHATDHATTDDAAHLSAGMLSAPDFAAQAEGRG